jgi:hypothetical protein
MSPAELIPERDCDGEASSNSKLHTCLLVREAATKEQNPQLSKETFKEKEKCVTGLDGGLTPG